MYDIIIIGSGIIGSMLAYDLSRFNVSVCVLEKNVEIMNEVDSRLETIFLCEHLQTATYSRRVLFTHFDLF